MASIEDCVSCWHFISSDGRLQLIHVFFTLRPRLKEQSPSEYAILWQKKNEQVTWLYLTWQKENVSFSHRRAADNWEKYALQHTSFFGHKSTLSLLMYPKDIYSPLNKKYKSPSISHKFWNLKVPIVQSRCGSFRCRNL